jgi:hypothetical protein
MQKSDAAATVASADYVRDGNGYAKRGRPARMMSRAAAGPVQPSGWDPGWASACSIMERVASASSKFAGSSKPVGGTPSCDRAATVEAKKPERAHLP